MRLLRACCCVAIGWGLAVSAANPVQAQQANGGVAAERADIGRLDTHIQSYDEALGVVSRLRRPLGAETECDGICYFPSSSRAISWRCSPHAGCDLHCEVNPPVGGCH